MKKKIDLISGYFGHEGRNFNDEMIKVAAEIRREADLAFKRYMTLSEIASSLEVLTRPGDKFPGANTGAE